MQDNCIKAINQIQRFFEQLTDYGWHDRYCNQLIKVYLKIEPEKLNDCRDIVKLIGLHSFLKDELQKFEKNKQMRVW